MERQSRIHHKILKAVAEDFYIQKLSNYRMKIILNSVDMFILFYNPTAGGESPILKHNRIVDEKLDLINRGIKIREEQIYMDVISSYVGENPYQIFFEDGCTDQAVEDAIEYSKKVIESKIENSWRVKTMSDLMKEFGLMVIQSNSDDDFYSEVMTSYAKDSLYNVFGVPKEKLEISPEERRKSIMDSYRVMLGIDPHTLRIPPLF